MLVAQAGKGTLATISRRYLAMVLQVSTRTVARLLAELRAYGYIATTHRLGSLGQTIGLRVELLDPLLPFWDCEAVTVVSPPIKAQILTNLLFQPMAPDSHWAKGLQDGMRGSGVAPFRPPSCTNRSR